MTIAIFPTSAPNSRVTSWTATVDATAGAEIYVVPLAAGLPAGTQFSVCKTDASANTVTINDTAGTTLGVLEAQGDAMTFFGDAVTWAKQGNSSASDVSTHAALATAHGSVGVVMGATTVDAKDVAAVLHPSTDYINDPLGHKVLSFPPSPGTPVNFAYTSNSRTGDPVEVGALGTDSDIDYNIVPNGAGVVTEKGTTIALSSGATIADAAASVQVVSPTVAEFNALVTKFNLLLAAAETGRLLTP
jgi:hypothetical protein